MKVGFLITARLKSTRLPKKLLLEANGENLMTWMVRRLKLSEHLDEIVIATSTNPEDSPLEEIAKKEGIKCFRGSEEDVIDRLVKAADEYKLDYVLSMTADCPLIPIELIPDIINKYKNEKPDLITCYELPAGMYITGLDLTAARSLLNMKNSERTEYWLNYFLKTDLFKVTALEIDRSLIRSDYRFVLDYPEDFTFLKTIYENLGTDTYKMKIADIIAEVDRHKEWADINKDCKQKGIERTNLDPDSQVKIKNN